MGALQDAIGTGSLDQADMLSRLLTRVAALDSALGSSQAAQRQLHNQLVELRGNVRPKITTAISVARYPSNKL